MNIAIAGYGIEGAASYHYWRNRGDEVTILDERPELIDKLPVDALAQLGEEVFSSLERYDMVVRTAGLPPRKLAGAQNVWSSTNEFFAQCPAEIIGVTGTKGKGTTSSMIASILSESGKTVHLVGNIGTPALEILPSIAADDIVVFELSSFQLWDLEYSPHIAVVLMIEPDHLDVHESFDEYVAAKANITRHQTESDIVIYNATNQFSSQIAEQSQAQEIAYPFAIPEFEASLQVPGSHNVENASAAIAATREYSVRDEAIREGLENFTGLPHRLKLVREVDGVKYYDDSISTTPGSAIAAIHSFPEVHKIILLGGSDKGSSYESVVRECAATDTAVLAVGETGKRIAELCTQYGVDVEYLDGAMPEIVARAHQVAKSGDIVILSPASASFDCYKNYVDRGDQFITSVESL